MWRELPGGACHPFTCMHETRGRCTDKKSPLPEIGSGLGVACIGTSTGRSPGASWACSTTATTPEGAGTHHRTTHADGGGAACDANHEMSGSKVSERSEHVMRVPCVCQEMASGVSSTNRNGVGTRCAASAGAARLAGGAQEVVASISRRAMHGSGSLRPTSRCAGSTTIYLIHLHAEYHCPRWRWILPCEALWDECAEDFHSLMECRVLRFGAAGCELVHGAVQHHAAPVECAIHLVYLEGHPWVALEYRELGSRRGSQVDPAIVIDVVDRLDVHPVMGCVCDPANIVARQNLDYLGLR